MFNTGFRQHRRSFYQLVAVFLCAIPIITGCNATKYLKTNEYLYDKTTITYTDSIIGDIDPDKLEDALIDLSKLEKNDELFRIFPLKTSLYMLGDTGIDHYIKFQETHDTKFFFLFDYDKLLKKIKPLSVDTSKFRVWLTTKAGDKPQLIDTVLISETVTRINNYLYNRGFFYGSSTFSVAFDQKKRTGSVNYEVTLNTLYKMRNIYYEINDIGLAYRITRIEEKSQLAPGKPFDVDLLKNERERLSDNLRNVGYYKFQKEYVYFEVDSTSGNDSLDVFVKISNPVNDTVHHPFRIKNIYVYPNSETDFIEGTVPDYAIHYSDSANVKRESQQKVLDRYIKTASDTAAMLMVKKREIKEISDDALFRYFLEHDNASDKQFEVSKNGKIKRVVQKKLRTDYYLINSKDNYKPKSIANNIFLNPENNYSDSLIQRTVASFSTLGMYKYVTVQVLENWDSTSYLQYIDLLIKLDPLPAKGVSYELNASTTADYLLGNSLNLSYTHKNLFHNLDQFKINLKGGIETQLGGGEAFINTSELNAGVGLRIPTFLWPSPFNVPKRYFPKTDINLNFNYIAQVNDFTLFNTAFEYSFSIYENSKKDRANKQHIVKAPIPTINIVRVPEISEEFKNELNLNPLLKQSFEEVVIVGYGYTFLLNTQKPSFHRWDQYLRASGEINTPFSDFIKVDGDYRVYLNLNTKNKIVARTNAGIAIPFKTADSSFVNTEVIPYVKQFFTGGAYSIRAFTVRKLGPGAYVAYDTSNFSRIDQVADIKIEFNLEYRFDIINILEGAVFCDVGNTFTLKKDPFRPHAEIAQPNFFKLLAVGPGIGLRLDLALFIIRLDAAYPLYDPALDGPFAEEYKTYYHDLDFEIPAKKVALNIAIGYPF